jgi:uncharacterized protein YqkB
MRKFLIVLFVLLFGSTCFAGIPGLDVADDKLAHFATGALVAKYCHDDLKLDSVGGMCVVTSVSLFKEWVDTQNGGIADEDDVKAALLGAACVYFFEDHFSVKMNDNGFSLKFKL